MSDNGQEKQVLFEIKQLCKAFGPTKVLDHIDAVSYTHLQLQF